MCKFGVRCVAVAWAIVGLGGCIGAPGIPGGPLQGTGISFNGAYGYALSPASVTLQSTSNGERGRIRDFAGDAVNFPLIPSRIGGRVGLIDWVDIAADRSWLDGGAEIRLGLPEGAKPFPVALSLGLRRGAWGPFELKNRGSSERRLRLEVYPRLAELRYVRVNLITSAGFSTGRRYHPFLLPDRYRYFDDSSEGFPGPTIDPEVLRDETRIEMSVGIEVRQRHLFASVVLMPYVVAKAEHLTATCGACNNWAVDSFESSFGAALFISAGVSFTVGKHEPEPRHTPRPGP